MLEYIGPFLLENVDVVWGMISPYTCHNMDSSSDIPLETRNHAASALVSLLHEAPLGTLISTDRAAQVPQSCCQFLGYYLRTIILCIVWVLAGRAQRSVCCHEGSFSRYL